MKVEPYLFFNGTCEEAFNFYAKVIGAKIEAMMKHEGTPAEAHTPKEWQQKIMHARMTVDGHGIMASDAPPGHQANQMSGFSVTLDLPTAAEVDRIYNAFVEGGEARMKPDETFFAKRFAMVADRFGTPWMLICPKSS